MSDIEKLLFNSVRAFEHRFQESWILNSAQLKRLNIGFCGCSSSLRGSLSIGELQVSSRVLLKVFDLGDFEWEVSFLFESGESMGQYFEQGITYSRLRILPIEIGENHDINELYNRQAYISIQNAGLPKKRMTEAGWQALPLIIEKVIHETFRHLENICSENRFETLMRVETNCSPNGLVYRKRWGWMPGE